MFCMIANAAIRDGSRLESLLSMLQPAEGLREADLEQESEDSYDPTEDDADTYSDLIKAEREQEAREQEAREQEAQPFYSTQFDFLHNTFMAQ